MKIAVIINPAAGPAGRRQSVEVREAWAAEFVRRHGHNVWTGVIDGPGHGADLARTAVGQGAELVIAWGGDGTINAVGSALLHGPCALGIVPAGSGNGLARELGIPSRVEAAFRAAMEGADRVIDAGELNGRVFFNVAGVGLDAHIAEVFARSAGHARGISAYVTTTVREVFRYQPSHYVVREDETGFVREGSALFISAANTRQWGSGAQIAPYARPDDGRLDLVLIDARPPLVIASQLWRLYTRSVAKVGGTVIRPVREVSISARPPAPVHVDGEPIGLCDQIAIRVRPAALRVRVPHP